MRSLSKQAAKELEALRKKNRKGLLIPAEIVQFAQKEETALHAYFTWDDSKAAELRRLDEAEFVIRLAVTVVKHPEAGAVKARLECSPPSARTHGGGYRLASRVIKDSQQYEELRQTAMAELAAFQRKYTAIDCLQPIFDAIEQVIGAVEVMAS